MADVFLFIKYGWKNIWEQKIIFLFSALPFLNQWLDVFQNTQEKNLLSSLFHLISLFIFLILFYVSLIGVPYLAYCFSTGKSVTIQETLSAIRKFSWRVFGCSCLSILILSPFIFMILAFSINNSTQPPQISDRAFLLFLSFSLFSAVWHFSIAGFFANDWNIRQTAKEAWDLFTAHFGVLALLGITTAIIFRLYTTASGILTVLIQSGFDITSLSQVNYINPFMTLNNNLLFLLINSVGQIIFTPFSVSVFILAYLKYSSAKIPSLPQ